MFKNLGQKFSSIIHTADLDSDSLFALCAASSLPPRQWQFRQARKAESGAPTGRDTAGTRQGHGSAVHPERAQYYSRDPLCRSESALPFTKTHHTSSKHASFRNFKLVCLSSERLVRPVAKKESFD